MERTFHPQRRVAVIGASSGIGRASAELLRDRGDAVLAVGRDAAKLAALAPRAPSGAGTLVVAQADAGDRAAIAAAVRPQGPLDALVIAASGGKGGGPFASLDLDELRAGFAEKFWVQLTALQAALDVLAPDASIVLMTGASARAAMPGTSGLAAINGALETMVPVLARELAPRRVNAISPGIIDTPWWDRIAPPVREEMIAGYTATIPMGRVGQAREVADAVAFLIDNQYVTGSVLELDGGFHTV